MYIPLLYSFPVWTQEFWHINTGKYICIRVYLHRTAMSVTTVPSPWPAPPSARQDGGWRFGRQQTVPLSWLFDLRRNVSITPRQLMGCYALLCVLSLLVAAGFWWRGVTIVSLFTGLELLAVGAALLVFARHAGDRETITLTHREMSVVQQVGPAIEQVRFRAECVR